VIPRILAPRALPTPTLQPTRAAVQPPPVRPPMQRSLASRSPTPRAPTTRMASSTPNPPSPPHVERLRHRHPMRRWHPHRLGHLRRCSNVVPAPRVGRRPVPSSTEAPAHRVQWRLDRTTPLRQFQGWQCRTTARGRSVYQSFALFPVPLRLLRVQAVHAAPRQRAGDKEAHTIAAVGSTPSLLSATASSVASRQSLLCNYVKHCLHAGFFTNTRV
jgi:hypothetical protein